LGWLTITPAEATTVYTPEQAAALDFGLTASVKLRLLFDRDVSGWQINVDTRDRVVTLKGVADTGGEKTRVVRIARERMVWPVSSIS
jgi:osmotically-inducible protein OsmY